MLKLLLLLSSTLVVHGRVCPPSCEPPETALGCLVYGKSAECSQDVRDISSSEAHCGCLWQNYIQTIEPDAKLIFTDQGNQCYEWAAKVCSNISSSTFQAYLEESERNDLHQNNDIVGHIVETPNTTHTKLHNLTDLITRIEQLEAAQYGDGLPKHRRRNGVEAISKEIEKELEAEKNNIETDIQRVAGTSDVVPNQEYIGKPAQSASVSWVEVVPESNLARTPLEKSIPQEPTVHKHIHQHWIDVDMPVDKFKLNVFMLILLLNILIVVIMIFCRGSGSSGKRTDTKRPVGDLDESAQWVGPDGGTGSGSNKQTSRFRNLIDKFKMTKKQNKRTYSPFIDMEPINTHDFMSGGQNIRTSSPYINAGMHQSPRRTSSQGLYETINEEADFLDHNYEDPIPPNMNKSDSRDFYKKKYSIRQDSGTENNSSPLKYLPRDTDFSNKSVSFSLPPGTFITLQDRMVQRPQARRKRKAQGVTMMPARMGYNK